MTSAANHPARLSGNDVADASRIRPTRDASATLSGFTMPWQAYLTLALLPGFFAGLFVVIGKLSGWSKLAERYRADREPDEGICFRGQDLRIGWFWNYSGGITYRVSPDSIYLAVWSILVGHAPLLIPWPEIKLVEERPGRWFSVAKIEVGRPPLRKLELPLRVIDASREWLPSQDPSE